MKIKYRITLVFTLMVGIILFLMCCSVYFFSLHSTEQQFNQRLQRKAISTVQLLKTNKIAPELVKQITHASPSALANKSLYVYDLNYNKTFFYNDDSTPALNVPRNILAQASQSKPFFFKEGARDGIAVEYNEGAFHYIVVVAAYDADRVEWLSKLRLILILSFLISIGIVIVAGYIFSLGLVRSIVGLADRIKHISSTELSQRLEAGEKDEVQQLATTINNLLDRLQFASATQRKFIDNASHELFTPLAAMSSQLDIALQNERTEEEYRNIIASVNGDVKNLTLLVRSLLEIAKITGAEKGLMAEAVRVDEVLMRLPAEMKKIDPTYNVKLVFDEFPEEESLFIIFGNEHLLYCAFNNIVHNACKFSSDKTAVIKLSFSKNKIAIAITDNGPGIALNEIEHIFQPFYRNEEINNLVPGFGLGLALANEIIRLYNGNIEVASQPGKGSTFVITLPCSVDALAPLLS